MVSVIYIFWKYYAPEGFAFCILCIYDTDKVTGESGHIDRSNTPITSSII